MRHIIMSHLFLSWCNLFLKFLRSRIWSIRYIEKCYHLLFRRLFLMNNQYINETYKVLFIKNGLFHFPAKCWIQCFRHTTRKRERIFVKIIEKRRQNSLFFFLYKIFESNTFEWIVYSCLICFCVYLRCSYAGLAQYILNSI